MQWIKTTDRLPKHGVSALVENQAGDYFKMEFNGSVGKDWYERNIKRWLDEESNVPVFSLEDMIRCWNKSHQVAYENTHYDIEANSLEADYSYIEKERIEYFKDNYKIDIP